MEYRDSTVKGFVRTFYVLESEPMNDTKRQPGRPAELEEGRRTERLWIRISEGERGLIDEAAAVLGVKTSTLLREAAVARAERVLRRAGWKHVERPRKARS